MKTVSTLALFLICASARGAEAFTIGLYESVEPANLARIKDAGFDTVFMDPKNLDTAEKLMREAARCGLKALLMPQRFQSLPRARTRRWPIAAWYLQDEPDVNRVPVNVLRLLSDDVRRWDPERMQTFVVGQGHAADRYGAIADILMLDWYPVPHLPLNTVGREIDVARKFVGREKPLWMVIQAFDWKLHPQRDPKKSRVGRFPNFEELRFMSYLSVLHGANGIFYFGWRPDGKSLLDFPEHWISVAKIARELSRMRPVFEGGTRIPLPFAPYADLEAAAWRYRGREYVVIVNTDPAAGHILPKALLERRWRPLFELRRDPREILSALGNSRIVPVQRVMVFEARSS